MYTRQNLILTSSWAVPGNPLYPRWDPFPAPLPPWWHLTCGIVTTQGASSLMASTSPSCHFTRCAHACPSSYRTPSSSAARSGESLRACPNPGPALLSERKMGSPQRTAAFTALLIRLKQALRARASRLRQVLLSLTPTAQPARPSSRWSATAAALPQALPGREGRALLPEDYLCLPQIQPGPREEMLRQHTVGGPGDRPAEAGGEGTARRPR